MTYLHAFKIISDQNNIEPEYFITVEKKQHNPLSLSLFRLRTHAQCHVRQI